MVENEEKRVGYWGGDEEDSGQRRGKVREGKAERRDEKLDLQICLDYYEIARLPVSGAQPSSRYFPNDFFPWIMYGRVKDACI